MSTTVTAATWQAWEHPRDWRGRFIRKGVHVRLSGGQVGRVVSTSPRRFGGGANVEVETTDGRRGIVPSDRITVAQPPSGSTYLGNGELVRIGDRVERVDVPSDGRDHFARIAAINEDGSVTLVGVDSGKEIPDVDPSGLADTGGRPALQATRDLDEERRRANEQIREMDVGGGTIDENIRYRRDDILAQLRDGFDPTVKIPSGSEVFVSRELVADVLRGDREIERALRTPPRREPDADTPASTPAPVLTPTSTPTEPLAADGQPLQVGERVTSNGRTGTITSVRPRSGIAVYTEDGTGRVRSARIDRFTHLPDTGEGRSRKTGPNQDQTPVPTMQDALARASTGEEWRAALTARRTEGTPEERIARALPYTHIDFGTRRMTNAAKTDVANAIEDAVTVYPSLRERGAVRQITVMGFHRLHLSERAMGAADLSVGDLYLNERYLAWKRKHDSAALQSEESGFLARYTSQTSGAYGTTIHELGHLAHRDMIRSRQDPSEHMVTEISIQTTAIRVSHAGWDASGIEGRRSTDGIKRNLSVYAASSSTETIAESFAEAMVMGPEARPLARGVTNELLSHREDGRTVRIPELREESADKTTPDAVTEPEPEPEPAPESLPESEPETGEPLAADGQPLRVGDRVTTNDRTGTVVSVRPRSGIAIYTGDDTGRRHSAKIERFTHADETPVTEVEPETTDEETFEERSARVSGTVRDALASGQDTESRFFDRESKTWDPERAALHDEIVNELYAAAAGVPNERRAIISGGLGGAGKSTVLRTHEDIDPSRYLTINADDVKEELARRGMVPDVEGLSPMEASALVHEESSYLSQLLAHRAYADGKNVIWDITMSSPGSVRGRLENLRENGYTTRGIFVSIPVETSVDRAMSRWRRGVEAYARGEGNGGRYVPPEIIRKSAQGAEGASQNEDTFNLIRSSFDDWELWDNSGTEPRRVASRSDMEAIDEALPETRRESGNLLAAIATGDSATRGGGGPLPGGYSEDQRVALVEESSIEEFTVVGAHPRVDSVLLLENENGEQVTRGVGRLVPAVEQLWVAPGDRREPTLAASAGGAATFTDMGVDSASLRWLDRTVRGKAVYLNVDKQRQLEVMKHQAMTAYGTRLGLTDDETREAVDWLERALGTWMMFGGRSERRDQMDVAMQHLRDGGAATTAAQRGMLLQKAWTDATWNSRYGDEPVRLSRFVQGLYAARFDALRQVRGEEPELNIESWPLTSWAVDTAADKVQSRWIGRDTYAVRLDRDVTRDETWLTFWSEGGFRTSDLKAPGEMIIDDRAGSRPPNFVVESVNRARRDEGTRKTPAQRVADSWAAYIRENPETEVEDLAAMTELAVSPGTLRSLLGSDNTEEHLAPAAVHEDLLTLVQERDIAPDQVTALRSLSQELSSSLVTEWLYERGQVQAWSFVHEITDRDVERARRIAGDAPELLARMQDQLATTGINRTELEIRDAYLPEQVARRFINVRDIPEELREEAA